MLLSSKQQSQSKIKSTTGHRREKIASSEKDNQWSVSNMGSPKVHFSGKTVNRSVLPVSNTSDPITSHHRDNVTCLSEEWEKVKANLNKSGNGTEATEYVERNPNPLMQNFRPFDLEGYWGQRQLKNVS